MKTIVHDMVKVFRRLRRSLVQKRKLGSYLLYALGEIILVVIGILIALAINNANQRHAERQKEEVYLAGLQDEFRTSKNKLEVLMAVNNANIEGAKSLLILMEQPQESVTEVYLSKLILQTFANDISFNSNNSLLEEMVSSGSLKDIRKNTLRIALTNWLSTLVDIARQESELDLHRRKVVDMFRSDEQSLRTIFDLTGVSDQMGLPHAHEQDSNLNVLQSNAFENNVLTFMLTSEKTNSLHYEPLMENINVIFELIENELQ